jgi:hypothetical protein
MNSEVEPAGSSWLAVAARGFQAGAKHPGRSIAIAHLAVVPVLVMYLVVVVGLNSLVFGYNFWNEPAPSSLADGVAVVSLLALAGVAVIAIGVMYTGMCVAARSSASAMSAYRVGASATMRKPVIPAGALVMVAATLSGIAGPIALAALGWVPVAASSRPSKREGYFGSLARMSYGPWLVGFVAAPVVSILFWSSVLGPMAMAERFDGAIEALGAPILWVSLSLAAVVLGATASAFSALYNTEVDAENTGREPPPGFGSPLTTPMG